MMKPEFSYGDVEKFYELCDDAYRCWKIRRVLFDDNSKIEAMLSISDPARYCFAELGCVLQEAVIIKISKIHDKAHDKYNNYNLSMQFILDNCGKITPELNLLANNLSSFYNKIKSARHKFCAHNSRAEIFEGGFLGRFDENEDVEYFAKLQQFVNGIAKIFGKEVLPFYEKVTTEAEELLQAVLLGLDALYGREEGVIPPSPAP